MSLNTNKPAQRDVQQAIQNLIGATCAVELIETFIQSGEHDMEKFSWHVGEALGLIRENLSDVFCVLNANAVKITAAEDTP